MVLSNSPDDVIIRETVVGSAKIMNTLVTMPSLLSTEKHPVQRLLPIKYAFEIDYDADYSESASESESESESESISVVDADADANANADADADYDADYSESGSTNDVMKKPVAREKPVTKIDKSDNALHLLLPSNVRPTLAKTGNLAPHAVEVKRISNCSSSSSSSANQSTSDTQSAIYIDVDDDSNSKQEEATPTKKSTDIALRNICIR